jgi:cell division septal protein FtsQ
LKHIRYVVAGLLIACLALGSLAVYQGPARLRGVPLLRAENVRVEGNDLLRAEEVLELAGIRHGAHTWDDAGPWETALVGHPLVASARVTRELPRTLVVRIVERRALALVGGDVVHPVTVDGLVVPLDLSGRSVDLPLFRPPRGVSLDSLASDSASMSMLRGLARLAVADPALHRLVSEVRVGPTPQDMELVLAHPLLRVWASDVGEARLDHLARVVADHHRRHPEESELPMIVDLRFRGLAIVRPASSS